MPKTKEPKYNLKAAIDESVRRFLERYGNNYPEYEEKEDAESGTQERMEWRMAVPGPKGRNQARQQEL